MAAPANQFRSRLTESQPESCGKPHPKRVIIREGWYYAPRGQSWFVLSGERDGRMFYEKVMFSCRGSVISSFAMIYPIESRHRFDRIVEGIEKSFRSGHECGRYASY